MLEFPNNEDVLMPLEGGGPAGVVEGLLPNKPDGLFWAGVVAPGAAVVGGVPVELPKRLPPEAAPNVLGFGACSAPEDAGLSGVEKIPPVEDGGFPPAVPAKLAKGVAWLVVVEKREGAADWELPPAGCENGDGPAPELPVAVDPNTLLVGLFAPPPNVLLELVPKMLGSLPLLDAAPKLANEPSFFCSAILMTMDC